MHYIFFPLIVSYRECDDPWTCACGDPSTCEDMPRTYHFIFVIYDENEVVIRKKRRRNESVIAVCLSLYTSEVDERTSFAGGAVTAQDTLEHENNSAKLTKNHRYLKGMLEL
jgi:hypothetical protein